MCDSYDQSPTLTCPGSSGGFDLPRRIEPCLHPASTTRRPVGRGGPGCRRRVRVAARRAGPRADCADAVDTVTVLGTPFHGGLLHFLAENGYLGGRMDTCPGGFGGIGRDDGHAAAFDGGRPVRTERPDTAAATIRINSALPRIPAAPSRSICTDTPGVRDSGWQPGPDPKVSRSSADQVAAGIPVWCAAISDADLSTCQVTQALSTDQGGDTRCPSKPSTRRPSCPGACEPVIAAAAPRPTRPASRSRRQAPRRSPSRRDPAAER